MDISNMIKDLKYKRDRAKYLGHVTQKIGTLIEYEHEIFCNVYKRSSLNRDKNKDFYELNCNGIDNQKDKEMIDYFKLNKQFEYYFGDIRA